MKKQICKCDVCGFEEIINLNYGRPNRWLEVEFISQLNHRKFDFCSQQCLLEFINNNSLGNALSYEFNVNKLKDKKE